MQRRIATVLLAILVSPLGNVAQSSPPPTSKPIAVVPPDCDKPELLAKGRPVMIPWHNDLSLGISLAKQEFKVGEPIMLHIWADNPGDAPASVQGCGDMDFFEAYGLELFGADGHRILSRSDTKLAEQCKTAQDVAWACTMNGVVPIPARTCEKMGSVNLNYSFSKALTNSYHLPPGKYTIRLRQSWGDGGGICEPHGQNSASAAAGPTLIFSIKRP